MTQNQQAVWWPDLLTTWNGSRVAEPGKYADHLPDGKKFLTCYQWYSHSLDRCVLSLSRYDLNIIHGHPNADLSGVCQALLTNLCQQQNPGLTACVLTGTEQTWMTWITRMANQELLNLYANIHIMDRPNIWTDQGLTLLMNRLTDLKPDILLVDNLNTALPPGQSADQAHTWSALFQNLNIVSKQATEQTGKHIVQIGTVVETEPALLATGSSAVWAQTGLTLRVIPSTYIPSADHNNETYYILYPTVGGKNRDNIPVYPVSIRKETTQLRTTLAERFLYNNTVPARSLTDILGLKPDTE